MKDRKLETRKHKIERLVKWEHVDQVNEMLVNGVSPHKVSAWCKDMGFDISHPKLYEYKDMLQTAIQRNITVERLLGIGVPKRSPIQLQALGITDAKDMVKNEMELLDLIIQKGYNSAKNNPDIKLQDAMRAMELKNKITGGEHEGFTGYGLDRLRELEKAKFDATVQVVLKYLPEDKHQEVAEAIEMAERNFLEAQAPELLEEYEQALQQDLDDSQSGDNTVVTDF